MNWRVESGVLDEGDSAGLLRDSLENHFRDTFLKENATVFPYSYMFFPQLRGVDMYLSRLSPCT